MMSTKERAEFIKLLVSEGAAYLFATILSWSLSYIVIGLLYLFASNDIATGKLFFISQAFEDWLFTSIALISFLTIYLWRISYYKEQIDNWKSENESISFAKILLIGVGAGLLIYAFIELYELIFVNLFGESYFPADFWLEHRNSPLWQRGLIFFTLVFLTPFCYELFFREMCFGNIYRNGFIKTAYVFSILLFCISGFIVQYFLFIVIYGIILAFLYQKTRSIIAPILANITLYLCSYYILIY